jgi:tight adherence protein B
MSADTAVYLLVALCTAASVSLLIVGFQQQREAKRTAAALRVERHIDASEHNASVGGRQQDALLLSREFSSIQPVDALLRKTTWAEKQSLELARADLPLRVSEYLLLTAILAMGLGLLGYLTNGWFALVVFAAIGAFGPRLWVMKRQADRLKKFNDQLLDMLALVANSLKVGYGITQAIETAARELPRPMSDELHRLVRDINLGVNPETALTNFMLRVHSYDLELIVTSILIQRKTGGNLAEVLENISHTIRERIEVHGEIRTLTAEGRISGYVLAGLPFVVMIALQFINPNYIGDLLAQPIGRLMLLTSLVLIFVGFFIIRKLSDIRV